MAVGPGVQHLRRGRDRASDPKPDRVRQGLEPRSQVQYIGPRQRRSAREKGRRPRRPRPEV